MARKIEIPTVNAFIWLVGTMVVTLTPIVMMSVIGGLADVFADLHPMLLVAGVSVLFFPDLFIKERGSSEPVKKKDQEKEQILMLFQMGARVLSFIFFVGALCALVFRYSHRAPGEVAFMYPVAQLLVLLFTYALVFLDRYCFYHLQELRYSPEESGEYVPDLADEVAEPKPTINPVPVPVTSAIASETAVAEDKAVVDTPTTGLPDASSRPMIGMGFPFGLPTTIPKISSPAPVDDQSKGPTKSQEPSSDASTDESGDGLDRGTLGNPFQKPIIPEIQTENNS